MEIKLHRHARTSHYTCYVCGAEFDTSGILAEVSYRDELLGQLCRQCAGLDAPSIRERLRKRAIDLHAQASFLFEQATARSQSAEQPIIFPLREQYQIIQQKIVAEHAMPVALAKQAESKRSRHHAKAHVDLSTLGKAG